MADAAPIIQYRNEFVATFEDRLSVLPATCIREAVIKGNQATFLVAGSNGATATTRGTNGLIPRRSPDLTQTTATLNEWHDLEARTDFNIFESQGDASRIMQMNTMGTINRKLDDLIIAELDTATNDTGTAATASLDLVVYAQTILGNNFVDITDEENLFMLVSPAFRGYISQTPEFSSGDYVDVKPLTGTVRRFWRWMGFNWAYHPRLTNSIGAGGTSTSEQCFAYHRNAVGCAMDTRGMSVKAGFDDEQAYSWSRVSIYTGAKLLLNSGVVMVKHNGAGYAAQ